MKKIPVASIEDGMILGKDICGSNGNILITRGSSLSSAIGRRLESWGITTVVIEGEEETPLEATTPSESPEELKQFLLDKFDAVMDNPLMVKILNAVYDYRCSKT